MNLIVGDLVCVSQSLMDVVSLSNLVNLQSVFLQFHVSGQLFEVFGHYSEH